MFGILKMLVDNMLRKTSAKDVQQARKPNGSESGSSLSSKLVSHDFERVYEENIGLLVSLAIRKFGVPAVDAEALAHEVFRSYLGLDREIPDLHHWLVGAICSASRDYWRKHRRNIGESDEGFASSWGDAAMMSVPESLPLRSIVDEVLAGLPARYQHILRLRYVEGHSIKEIAEQLSVTQKYTYKLVAKCLRMAQERYRTLESAAAPEQHTADNQTLREVVAGFVEAYQDVG